MKIDSIHKSKFDSLRIFLVLCITLLIISNDKYYSNDIFIRSNQLGFHENETKSAIIISNKILDNQNFIIKNYYTDEPMLIGEISNSMGPYGNFNFSYQIDFSEVNQPGKYVVLVDNTTSYPFSINQYVYNGLVDSLLTFFKIQRCGFNSPELHEFCHYYDATNLILDEEEIDEKKDLTGGWHDAGDYIKFLNTIAYTTYTLLFSYDFNKSKLSKDVNNNKIPDIVDEALIGVDWLIKANYRNKYLITQIQDLRDQNTGWRLPENDKLVHDRPAFLGNGKNIFGIYSATLALSYRILKNFDGSKSIADSCLTLAEKFYKQIDDVPDLYSSATGHYQDSRFYGKIALAAIELYLSTSSEKYLSNAKNFATNAGSDYWWSWGDINSYAHYRIAKIDSSYSIYIKNNLTRFLELSAKNIFGEVINNTWGTNNTNLGVALQSILWEDLTSDTTFNSLILNQRDYVLGKNPWGISFIYNFGTNFTKHFHSQVAYFNGGQLTGALSAGPISKSKLNEYNITLESNVDPYQIFQTDEIMYRDDRMDYITNEPTISANATAVFVFAYFINN